MLPALGAVGDDIAPQSLPAEVTPKVADIGGSNFDCTRDTGGAGPAGLSTLQVPNPPQSQTTLTLNSTKRKRFPAGVSFTLKGLNGPDKGKFFAFQATGANVFHVAVKGGSDQAWYNYRAKYPGGVTADGATASNGFPGTNPSTGLHATKTMNNLNVASYADVLLRAGCHHQRACLPRQRRRRRLRRVRHAARRRAERLDREALQHVVVSGSSGRLAHDRQPKHGPARLVHVHRCPHRLELQGLRPAARRLGDLGSDGPERHRLFGRLLRAARRPGDHEPPVPRCEQPGLRRSGDDRRELHRGVRSGGCSRGIRDRRVQGAAHEPERWSSVQGRRRHVLVRRRRGEPVRDHPSDCERGDGPVLGGRAAPHEGSGRRAEPGHAQVRRLEPLRERVHHHEDVHGGSPDDG